MNLETIVNGLIIVHASSGGIALLSGGLAQIFGKGGKKHKRAGKTFYISMLLSACSALLISVFPNHENAFLFAIGTFSIYFVITGYRATRYKNAMTSIVFDKLLSWLMILVGLLMIVLPAIIRGRIHIIMTVFGAMVVVFSVRDIMVFRDKNKTRKNWLALHIVKIMSAYISAFTAFVVVNALLPGMWGWFVPGIVGSVFIVIWMRKLEKGTIKFTS